RAKGASTMLGTLAQWLLIGIGVFILAGLWTDPNLVFAWIAAAGFDLEAYFPDQPIAPYFVAAMGGVLFLLLGLIVVAIRRRSGEFIEDAKRRKKALEAAPTDTPPPG
ncbi:MAG TPA: hypothetical protein VI818_03795, partial [Candidatus Thermoplasmatota archaeon]|nr:hypothetical protein [Candidatus Thermoplasmatota archaeon]